MGVCVLLLHELSDGDSHYDWLIDPHEPHEGGGEGGEAPGGDPDERVLIAFRLSERIDLALPRRFEGERMADHRRLYLAYEGPLSGGRGQVRRLATGWMRVERAAAGELVVAGRLGEAGGRLRGVESEGGRWQFCQI